MKKLMAVLVPVAIAIVGVHLLTLSHASTALPYGSATVASGTIVAPASAQTDGTAISGKSLLFGSVIQPPPPPPSSYVTTSGTNFMLGGKTFQFIGFDAYGMEGCYNGSPWTTAQLDAYFSALPANGVTRIWAFRTYGTAILNTILTEAAKYHQHLILTLGDDDASCGETDGAINGNQSGKTTAFYQTGWQQQWLTWVNTVVPMFKTNTSIMMWEVANEPGQKPGTVQSLATMQAYLQGTSNAVRADDPNHLISVGANDVANFGGLSNYEQALNLPNIDAISFHDYSYEYESGAVVSSNYNNAKTTSQLLHKPFYGGEAGVPSGTTCNNLNYSSLTLSSRVSFLTTKAHDYLGGGAGGIDFWKYEPSRASWVGACAYEMYPGDPMLGAVQNYTLP
jgi:hypothetical protein